MARTGTVAVNFIGHTEKLRGAIVQAEKDVGSFGDKLKTFGGNAVNFGKKMSTFVTLPVLGAGVAAFKMAGDFGESFSKMETVFGASAKDIDKWSKTSAAAMGLSRKEAIDAAGTFGNMFTQLGIATPQAAAMSTEMIQLAADLGSFHNADITDVIDAQSSAFRGEYDALQRYIPTINAAAVEQKALQMTGKETTKELTLQEKALAVQALMMAGAGQATGDFERTADSAANKQRTLTAEFKNAATELGTNLMPIGQKILGWVTTLAEKFGGLSPTMQTTILVVAGVAAAIGPLVTVVGALSLAFAFLAANPIVLVIAAIVALGVAIWKNWETIQQAVSNVKGWIIERWDEVVGFLGGLPNRIRGAVAGMWDGIKESFRAALNWIIEKWNGLEFGIGGQEVFGIRMPGVTIGTPNLPRFHQGGVVPGAPGSEMLGLLRAGERVIPNGAAASPIVIQLVVDGKVLTEVVHNGMLEKQRRSGALGLA